MVWVWWLNWLIRFLKCSIGLVIRCGKIVMKVVKLIRLWVVGVLLW